MAGVGGRPRDPEQHGKHAGRLCIGDGWRFWRAAAIADALPPSAPCHAPTRPAAPPTLMHCTARHPACLLQATQSKRGPFWRKQRHALGVLVGMSPELAPGTSTLPHPARALCTRAKQRLGPCSSAGCPRHGRGGPGAGRRRIPPCDALPVPGQCLVPRVYRPKTSAAAAAATLVSPALRRAASCSCKHRRRAGCSGAPERRDSLRPQLRNVMAFCPTFVLEVAPPSPGSCCVRGGGTGEPTFTNGLWLHFTFEAPSVGANWRAGSMQYSPWSLTRILSRLG